MIQATRAYTHSLRNFFNASHEQRHERRGGAPGLPSVPRELWYEPRARPMGYPLTAALRYLASKKRNMVSISTALAVGGVTLGVAALTVVMSVTGGFQEQFREKVLGVNAHVLVLKYSIDFREYRDVMKELEHVPGVVGVAPFVINPMMVTHGDRTATGVLLKGVDPGLMPTVLDLPKHVVEGSLEGLRREGAKPPERAIDTQHRDYDSPPHTSLSTPDRPGASDTGAGAG